MVVGYRLGRVSKGAIPCGKRKTKSSASPRTQKRNSKNRKGRVLPHNTGITRTVRLTALVVMHNDRLNSAEVYAIQCVEHVRADVFQDFRATRFSVLHIYAIKKCHDPQPSPSPV